MVFSSAVFLFGFLPLVFLLSRFGGIKYKNILLALASIAFYSFGQLNYVPLFLASVLINYFFGVLIPSLTKGRKAALAVAVLLNLGILCVYKYTDFIIRSINAAAGASFAEKNILLPIGISFFTFQGLSYVIDVYRAPETGTKNFLKVLLYISFFPQLIAGPIVKYHDIADQIDSRTVDASDLAEGFVRFIRGLGKKVLIANAAGYVADQVLAAGSSDWRMLWVGCISYTLQIYYDFSGYSDMAIGLGRIFGFRFLENFNYPYAAASLTEFWRRWHISLSTWFKEYLYIPLGGNRKGKGRTVLNKLTVFLATGIWHGANWTFVFWGLCHGLLCSAETAGVIPVEKLGKTRVGRILCRIYTLLMVSLLFLIFRMNSLGEGFAAIAAMFRFRTEPGAASLLGQLLTPAALAAMAIGIICAGNVPNRLRARLPDRPAVRYAAALAVFLLSVFSLSLDGFNPFIYFQF